MHKVVLASILIGSGVAALQKPQVVNSQRNVNYEELAPAGQVVVFQDRPRDLVLSKDGSKLWVRTMGGLRVFDSQSLKELGILAVKGGGTFTGLHTDGDSVWISSNDDKLQKFGWKEGKIVAEASIDLPKGSRPSGFARIDSNRFVVCLTNLNLVGIVDIAAKRTVRRIATGIAPYDVVFDKATGQAWATCLGGPRPRPGKKTALSAGSAAEVDERGVVANGVVSVVDVDNGIWRGDLAVGLQPTVISIDSSRSTIYVANSNSDTVSVIDSKLRFVSTTLNVKPDAKLMFGSMPNGVTLDSSGKQLFVSLSGNNLVAVYDRATLKFQGHIPTGWFPGGIVEKAGTIWIPNQKGVGSTVTRRPVAQGKTSWDLTGSLQRVSLQEAKWQHWKAPVSALAKLLTEVNLPALPGKAPVPVPARFGEPSVLKHVVYIIKENRTYDQVFGDMKEGDGDPKLCVFPEKITPNHHALARQFGLLDNYYCNGVCSADGHSWAIEGNVTPYLERQFGSWNRAYDYGTDPLTFSSSGLIWDWILGKGLSFYNFGELDVAEVPKGFKMTETWRNASAFKETVFEQKLDIDRLRKHSSRNFPGWNMAIPDTLRADRFMTEFDQWEKDGVMPHLTIIYLPQDHTAGLHPGYPSAASYLADNDLALGRIVERLSKSSFWKDTVVFANEDDPQAGFDHVDGNRSLCLVASPYSRGTKTVKKFYNQNSVLHTICRIFGIPAPNQKVAIAPLMTDCFSNRADLTPFQVIDPEVDRTAMNKPIAALKGVAKRYALEIQKLGLRTPDFPSEKADDMMNRSLWFAMKGNVPYPANQAGTHGRGLNKRGLKHDRKAELKD